MSIINDALKKLQRNPKPEEPKQQVSEPVVPPPAAEPPVLTPAQQAGFQPILPPTPPPVAPTPPPEPAVSAETPTATKARESNLVYILAVVCILIALFAPIINNQSIVGKLFDKKPSKTARAVQRTQAQPSSTAVKEVSSFLNSLKPPIPPATEAKAPEGRILVSGIMSRGDQNVALIDGQVYEEGEEINGVKIVKITAKNVVVLENGVERTIKAGETN